MQSNLQDYVKNRVKATLESYNTVFQEIAELAEVSRQNVQQWHDNKSPILLDLKGNTITKIWREPKIKVYFERRSQS